jgi:TRAP-type C4-dicarboxylate transport system permease small subunit
MKLLAAAHRSLLEALGFATGLMVAATALVIALDVVLRATKTGSIAWANEITEHSVFVATFFAVPWVMRLGGHIQIDIVFALIGDETARYLQVLNSFIGVVVSAVLCYYGLIATLEVYETGRVIFRILTPKEWWLLAVIPFSLSLLTIEFLLRLIRLLRKSTLTVEPRRSEKLGL